MKRTVSVLLVFTIIFCSMPFQVNAIETNDVSKHLEQVSTAQLDSVVTLDKHVCEQLYNVGDNLLLEPEPDNNYKESAGLVYHDCTIEGSIGGYDLDWNYFTLTQQTEVMVMIQSYRAGPDFAIYDQYGENILFVSSDNWYSDGYYYDALFCTLNPGMYFLLILDMDGMYPTTYRYYFQAIPTGYDTHTHNYSYSVFEPTCTTDGYTYYECSCGENYTDNIVSAHGHTEVKDPAVAATCTTAGKTEGVHCSVCNTVLIPQQNISAKGHTAVIDYAVTATCTTDGKTEGKHCSVCKTVLVAQQIIPSIGHTYSHQYDYQCNICYATRNVDMTRPMVDMFRMYNPNTGEHFYTGSDVERDNLIAVGWQYEGVGFTFPLTTGKPVYRLFQPSTGEHLYTMDEAEKAKLMAEGWNFEGIAFNSGFENEVPQYRLHNPNTNVGAYHFTASEVEKNNLIAAGWEYQGIGWYSLGA